MPTRRKNLDLSRLKRSSKRNRICDLFSSPYVQYLLIFLIWGLLLFINRSTDMRFEYFWPGWLFICSIHDSMKFQGMQYTIVFIIIVLTVDLVCFFVVPATWVYICGSAYVWVYLLWHTDQGLCFLTLSLCFVFVYFELHFYPKDIKSNQSIYLFRPFAAHSIGYSVVCTGFSIKRYLDVRYRNFKRIDVRRQNFLHFRILHEALPPSAITESCCVQNCLDYLQKELLEVDGGKISEDFSSDASSRSVVMFLRFGQSCLSCLGRWAFGHFGTVDKHHSDYDRTGGTHNSCAIRSAAMPNICTSDSGRRRIAQCLESSPPTSQANRRCAAESPMTSDSHSKTPVNGCLTKQCTSGKPVRERGTKEDPVTRLENNVRRLRCDVQSMRALETQLRNQLENLQRDDRLNRLSLSNQRQENEAFSSRISKLTNRCRNERANLNNMEQSLNEEIRLRQLVEAQLTEMNVTPVCNVSKANSNISSSSSTEQSIPTSVAAIQESSSNEIATNADTIHQQNDAHNVMNNYCCKLRQLLESKLYTLRLAVKHRENLTLASKMRPSDQLTRKCLTNISSKTVVTSSDDGSSHQYEPRSSTCKLQSGHLAGKDTCRVLNSEGENVNDTSNNHDTSTNKHRHAFLENCFNLANEERERLASNLRTENWQKQELLTLYHTSVREITELNKTLKQRDLQILELTVKIEQLECLPKSTKTCDSVSLGGYTATSAAATTQSPCNLYADYFPTGDKDFNYNKQQISSMLSGNSDIMFSGASTNTLENMFIHPTSEKYDHNNNGSSQNPRFCVTSPTPPIASFTNLTGYHYSKSSDLATYHYKTKQNHHQILFRGNTNHGCSSTANFNTNLSSSCLLPSETCSSSSSSSSCSSNANYSLHTDMQIFNNYKETPIITSLSGGCLTARRQKDQKQQQNLAADAT
ncbi:unnamed protein product [Trichobilharzia szidati]|nr:unnamed protein product [Trichobilharzia szidati]